MPVRLMQSFSCKEKGFLFLAMLCGFLISADYAVIRPASQSLFIHAFGAKMFPYAWLFSVPFNLTVVALYNYFLPRIGCLPLFRRVVLLIMLGNICTGFLIKQFPLLSFPFYIWKEVYVLLMFQQVWSVIHSTISMKNAKYLYGVLFGVGALGGCLGSLIPGFFAVRWGSEALFFCTIPIYTALFFVYMWFFRFSSFEQKKEPSKERSPLPLIDGLKLIGSSRLLRLIVLLTLCMQIVATLTDFQFQSFLEKAYPEKDLRTEIFGRVVSIGNILTMFLQFFGTFFCIRYLGLQRSHLLVPVLLFSGAALVLVFPAFSLFSAFFVTLKSLEFSVFIVIKEMLYIPMRLEEKFQAKAIIDVFVFRASKVVASIFIMFLQNISQVLCFPILSWITIFVAVLWCRVVMLLKTSYQESEKLSI